MFDHIRPLLSEIIYYEGTDNECNCDPPSPEVSGTSAQRWDAVWGRTPGSQEGAVSPWVPQEQKAAGHVSSKSHNPGMAMLPSTLHASVLQEPCTIRIQTWLCLLHWLRGPQWRVLMRKEIQEPCSKERECPNATPGPDVKGTGSVKRGLGEGHQEMSTGSVLSVSKESQLC